MLPFLEVGKTRKVLVFLSTIWSSFSGVLVFDAWKSRGVGGGAQEGIWV